MGIAVNQGNVSVGCYDYATILQHNGKVVENIDGSVSVYIPDAYGQMAPQVLTKTCCLAIKDTYTFDIDTQTCKWSNAGSCSYSDPLKLVLNPKGNDGSLFYVDGNDTCSLSVDFDYLFKIKCETLVDILTNGKPPSAADIQTELQIKALETQIAQQTKTCQSLSNQITQVTSSINNTSYSIICSGLGGGNAGGGNGGGTSFGGTVDVGGLGIGTVGAGGLGGGLGGGVVGTGVGTGTFGNTGFGTGSPSGTGVLITGTTGGLGGVGFGTGPFGFGTTVAQNVIYCLTEPAGLAQWAIILGNVNYQNFLNGNQDSYSCGDIQTLLTMNDVIISNNILDGQQSPILVQECSTSFGTKTNLIKQLNTLTAQQIACQNTLSALTAQLTAVKSTLSTFTSCNKPIQVFESFDASMTIDIVTSANTLQTVYENNIFPEIGPGSLYTYLSGNTASGFYICGDPTITETTFSACTPLSLNITGITQPNVFSCNSIMNNIVQDLYAESQLSAVTGGAAIFANNIAPSALQSPWLHFHTLITDPSILSLIDNKKIKISIKINHTCSDFCVLVDEIVLDKVCTHVQTSSIFVSKSPGFDLDRIRDNKKSWIANTTPVNRPFVISNNLGGNSIRRTNYNVNDERLVINTKEIDLDISLASAIETDVWCYVVDNSCLFTGITCEFTTSCPSGYTQINSTQCSAILTTSATTAETIYTGSVMNSMTINPLQGNLGGYFYEDITNKPWPIQAYSGSQFTAQTIVDNASNIVNVTNIELNTLWGGVGVQNYFWRLNTVGVWANPYSGNNPPYLEWIGFSVCVNVPETQTYVLGMAADDTIRVSLNNKPLINFSGSGFNWATWSLFPITLEAGDNIFVIEGWNDNTFGPSPATFGFEVYNASVSVLTGLTGYTQINPYILFSTKDLSGITFNVGENSGLSCPSGYYLDPCNGNVCTKTTIIDAIVTGNCCNPCSTTLLPPVCCDKQFQDDECFSFMDDVVYQFMEGSLSANCITGITTNHCCGDVKINLESLLTQPVSAITTVEDFEYFMTSELIDAKDRKTLSGYPTLRALYDRYMNSSAYCSTNSSKFDYRTIDQFAGLVGNYWVDIVEQVVPATTIWGSVKIYSNTIFDQQKFKYKSYSSLFCGNPWSGQTILSPINGKSGTCANVSVSMTPLNNPSNTTVDVAKPTSTCNTICLAQMNAGSEFIGTIKVIGPNVIGSELGTGTTFGGGVIIVTAGGLGTGTTGPIVGSSTTFSGVTIGATAGLGTGTIGTGNPIGVLGSGTIGGLGSDVVLGP